MKECVDYGLPEPELIDFDGDFRAILYRDVTNVTNVTNFSVTNIGVVKAGTKAVNRVHEAGHRERLVQMVEDNPFVTQNELQKMLGVSLRTVKRVMSELQSEGILLRVGSSRSGKWIIRN